MKHLFKMATCNACGEPIVFRYVGGRPTPIHIHGNWCRGYRENEASRQCTQFKSIKSYVDPNAICPVCGQSVFYYQSPHGGRVFFNDLGWPWPKHRCTDNSTSIQQPLKSKRNEVTYKFCASDGSKLAVYDLDDFEVSETYFKFVFRRCETNKRRTGYLRHNTLKKAGLKTSDFFDAPSFVVNLDQSDGDSLRVDFICGRLGKIMKIKMSKKTP